jgi:hypothetical protein
MQARPIRRIVTGHDARGRAIVLSDAPAPHLRTSTQRTGVVFTNIWTTDRMPVEIHGSVDPVTPAMNLEPPRHGTNFRIVEFGPEKGYIGSIKAEDARLAFASMGGAAHALSGEANPRHPFMHRTKTVDYGIVLAGEIYLVLDDSEVLMRAGDICIQRGTNHSWSNRSDATCVMAFVLIDGDRLEP